MGCIPSVVMVVRRFTWASRLKLAHHKLEPLICRDTRNVLSHGAAAVVVVVVHPSSSAHTCDGERRVENAVKNGACRAPPGNVRLAWVDECARLHRAVCAAVAHVGLVYVRVEHILDAPGLVRDALRSIRPRRKVIALRTTLTTRQSLTQR
jgi:hypothetical protein